MNFNTFIVSLVIGNSIKAPPFEAIVPDRKGSDNMSEKQKQRVEDITSNIEKLPIEKQYQLLGVAQGLGMAPQPQAAKTEEK